MTNSIYDQKQCDLLLSGEYFGDGGALARAEEAYASQGGFKATMQLMGTIFSAISHCASQVRAQPFVKKFWYAWKAVQLIFPLDNLVYTMVVTDESMNEKLSPGERDVLIAGLLVSRYVSWWHWSFWYKSEAAILIRYQVKSLAPDHTSSLFAKARALKLKTEFTVGERDDFCSAVEYAVYAYAPDGAYPCLQWMDVARLSRMVGNTQRQQYAAKMDGRIDVLLKAGLPTN